MDTLLYVILRPQVICYWCPFYASTFRQDSNFQINKVLWKFSKRSHIRGLPVSNFSDSLKDTFACLNWTKIYLVTHLNVL